MTSAHARRYNKNGAARCARREETEMRKRSKILLIFLIWAVLMILSRVATGVHYLLDVLAGFALGLLIGWGWIMLQPVIYTHFAWLFDKSIWFQ